MSSHINTASVILILMFSGTTLASKTYAPIGGGNILAGGGMTLVGGGLVGQGLHHQNKFNTISNIHKRGGGE